MATPVVGGARSGTGGGIHITLNPPVEFILRQAGVFRNALARDLDKMYERFKPVLSKMEAEQWASKGHGAWPPLAASTLARKRGSEMMVETGNLRDSLVDPGRAMKIHGATAEWGTDVDFAIHHQDGGYVPGRPPQRQLIPDPFPVDERRKLEQVQVKWVNEIAARTFGRI